MEQDLIQSDRLQVKVVSGNILSVPVDAIMTCVNTGGLWFGGVDTAIQKAGGGAFYRALSASLNARTQDGDTVLVRGGDKPHTGEYKDILFVFDDLHRPLYELVRNGVITAYRNGITSIAMPMFRTGVMAGQVEKTSLEVAQHICHGILSARTGFYDQPMSIYVVLYELDADRLQALKTGVVFSDVPLQKMIGE